MKVRFALEAQAHIAAIPAYINERSPLAAGRVVGRIRAASERLGEMPYIGRTGAAPETREWVVTGLPYVIVYAPNPETDEVMIIGVYHGAQLRPGQEHGP
jgi:plasmid stabilization system protein ParE